MIKLLINSILESKIFIIYVLASYLIYFKHGPRSNKKVMCFHSYIKKELEKIFLIENGYQVLLEKNIKSYNSTGKKKCDIVVIKNNEPYIVFPVKLTMTNYKQNKNNSWENLTGELVHLKWSNPNLKIIPINIFMNKIPYLKKNKMISKFEELKYNDIKNYEILKEKNIVYDIINYIFIVEHENSIGERFDKLPKNLSFDKNTKYRSFDIILHSLKLNLNLNLIKNPTPPLAELSGEQVQVVEQIQVVKKLSYNQLLEICRNDKQKYKGFSKYNNTDKLKGFIDTIDNK